MRVVVGDNDESECIQGELGCNPLWIGCIDVHADMMAWQGLQ